MAGFVSWNPAGLFKSVDARIDAKMREMGEVGLAEARRLVPVDTGQLRDSIGTIYRQSDKAVQLYADKYYASFIEWGTRFHAAQPFLRPALRAMAKVWGGGSVNLELATPATPFKYIARTRRHIGGTEITVGRKALFGKRKARVKIGMHTY